MPSTVAALFLSLLISVTYLPDCRAHEYTFELPDSERMCFYEKLEKDIKCMLEFQVRDYRWLAGHDIVMSGAVVEVHPRV